MAIYYREQKDQIVVIGKTYPYRELIKALGGRFQPATKAWVIPHSTEHLAEVKSLCQRIGGGRLKEPASPPNKGTETDNPASPRPTKQESSSLASTEPSGRVVNGMSISELVQKVHLTLTREFPQPIWVVGEIHNLNQRARAAYLQLSEPKEGASRTASVSVNATIWHDNRKTMESLRGKKVLDQVLQEGLRVRVLAQVTLYRDRGSLSLQILDIDPQYTQGILALQREELLRELRARGLDQKNKMLTLRRFPVRVGLITAENSRAASDFLDQLQQYASPVTVFFYAAQMQGEGTLKQVQRGLQRLQEKSCDLIVIIRGGGSSADLRWFDSREIAFAIASCQVPILAAIGHHDDICVTEMIAFRREKTPTAAADFLVAYLQETSQRLDDFQAACGRRLQLELNSLQQKQQKLEQSFSSATARYFEQAYLRHQDCTHQLSFVFLQKQTQLQRRLDQSAVQLRSSAWESISRAKQKIDRDLQQISHRLSGKLALQEQKLTHFTHTMNYQVQRYLDQQSHRLQSIHSRLQNQDPKPWMSKGWTQLTQKGQRCDSVENLQVGDTLQARLLDGKIHLSIDHIEYRKAAHDPEQA